MRRYELTDAQFALLEPYLPPDGGVGRPWSPHRQFLNGLFWKLRSGAPWRDIPERYGPWQTIYDRYIFWCRKSLACLAASTWVVENHLRTVATACAYNTV